MDDKIEKLNAKISRLLGKKGNTPNLGGDEDTIGGGLYLVITLICIISLWIGTGVHYISDGFFGLAFNNGKLHEVINGPRLDVSLPVPFSSMIVIDGSASDMRDIKIDASDNNYRDLTKNDVEINALAQFSYQITDPVKFYYKMSSEKNNVDNMVLLSVAYGLHNYIRSESYALLHTSNLTIIGNQIKSVVDKDLFQYGISVVKINISKLSAVSAVSGESAVTSENPDLNQSSVIATKLIDEANAYKQDQIAKTRSSINQYNILLAGYKKTPQTVVEQMYYDTLAEIPAKVSTDDYKLLFMPLSELLKLANTNLANQTNGSIDVRDFHRSVERERNFGR